MHGPAAWGGCMGRLVEDIVSIEGVRASAARRPTNGTSGDGRNAWLGSAGNANDGAGVVVMESGKERLRLRLR
eukprot:6421708-Prymnesium_polylepis.1